MTAFSAFGIQNQQVNPNKPTGIYLTEKKCTFGA